MTHRQCPACGSSFVRHGTGRPKIYCSSTCRRNNWQEQNKDHWAALHRSWYLRNKQSIEERRNRWKAEKRAEARMQREAARCEHAETLTTRLVDQIGLPLDAAKRAVGAVAIMSRGGRSLNDWHTQIRFCERAAGQ